MVDEARHRYIGVEKGVAVDLCGLVIHHNMWTACVWTTLPGGSPEHSARTPYLMAQLDVCFGNTRRVVVDTGRGCFVQLGVG